MRVAPPAAALGVQGSCTVGGATVILTARRSTPARSANHQLTDDSTTLAPLLTNRRPSCYE
jgi:hypothetical protein